LLQSIPGIGPATTAWLLVATLNFELCATPQAAVTYVGLHPVVHESGTSVRGRPHLNRAAHGRSSTLWVKALYVTSVSAVRHNPALKVFYERLRAKGKPMKVARLPGNCCTSPGFVHKQQRFDPEYGTSQGRILTLG
jgi:transposase